MKPATVSCRWGAPDNTRGITPAGFGFSGSREWGALLFGLQRLQKERFADPMERKESNTKAGGGSCYKGNKQGNRV